MGGGEWKSDAWRTYRTTSGISNARSASDIYTTKSAKSEYLPYNVMRESCDSDEHPNSTPIILGLDVTGSMNGLLHVMADKLGVTMGEIYKRKCVPDPQICFAAIDDYITSENRSLQVTQFESDIRIAEQMRELEFIRRGGGNNWESYVLAWYFAARHTKCDVTKHGRKGIIITMGDDGYQSLISCEEAKVVFGDELDKSITVDELLSEVSRNWEVFHITMAEGGSYNNKLDKEWGKLLGSHSIVVKNYENIPEVIVSILEKMSGKSLKEITDSWDGSTGIVVADALKNLEVISVTGETGVVEF